ncbi:peptidyl-prolyl cis-trans isomerase [Rhizosaccharibacter radicis]|uniref:Parvulin-like PPIase n=1 Tax=Rhizosaccharibacter radicis TaxID=2782605 RepID=A0ABT1VV66_9PROT|nr:SurA N-terminal domain-containing protein [Acetobacteraceae bacterium KSS12]
MLAFLRRLFVGSWAGRILALLIFLSFAAWGVGDFITGLGRNNANNVATVGDRHVSADDFERAYRNNLAQVAQSQNGRDADPQALPYGEKREIAAQALQRLVLQAVVAEAAARNGLMVPDKVVRDTVFGLKEFQGTDGRFDRSLFDSRLRAAGLTEDRLIDLIRQQTAADGLVEPLRAGARASDELVRRAFDFGGETRVLDMVTFPVETQPTPAAPDEATLRRYYDNHKSRFQAPEYRHARVVLLSPATIARGADVSEADERKLYDELITQYKVPEKRSVQIMIAPDDAAARQVAEMWRGGAAWDRLQSANASSTPVALDDSTEAGIPSPELGKLAFAAPQGAVTGPTHTESGWVVLRVNKITPPVDRSFEQVRDELHDRIAQARARDDMSGRVQKLQDAIAGGGLDAIPTELGAVAAQGTLDAQGFTPDREPAPLPGSDAIRNALIARIFAVRQNDAPTLQQGPEDSWFAVSVDKITPPAPQSFDVARPQVLAAWTDEARRRAAETQAAALYAQANDTKNGGLAAVAATRPDLKRGISVRRNGSPDVPQRLSQIVFSLKPGESTMVDDTTGFIVATLTAIRHPDPATDKLGYDRTRQALDRAVGDDIELSYVGWLRDRMKPSIDPRAIDRMVGPATGGEGGASDGNGS